MTTRAYVITRGNIIGHGVVKLVSNKKLALEACEKLLPNGKWSIKEKHYGAYEAEDEIASYQMFYVNGEKA